jgi:hypothetical protein
MSKTKATSQLQRFDVITSPKFQFGMRQGSRFDDKPTEVGFDKRFDRDDGSDATRVLARFVVLNAGYGGETIAYGGPHDTWWEVTAQRLADDGSYNPEGEIIQFKSGGWDSNVDDVTYLGRMTLSFVPEE